MKSKKSIQRSGHKEWRGHPQCIVARDFSPSRCKVTNIFPIIDDFRRKFAENVENGVIYCLSECRREILQISNSKKNCDFASTSTKSLGTPVFIGIPRGGGYFLSSTYPPPF